MKTFYRSHTIEVNSEPSGNIVYDVFQRGQHVLAGFSRTDFNETSVLERMKVQVDQFLTEAPLSSFTR